MKICSVRVTPLTLNMAAVTIHIPTILDGGHSEEGTWGGRPTQFTLRSSKWVAYSTYVSHQYCWYNGLNEGAF